MKSQAKRKSAPTPTTELRPRPPAGPPPGSLVPIGQRKEAGGNKTPPPPPVAPLGREKEAEAGASNAPPPPPATKWGGALAESKMSSGARPETRYGVLKQPTTKRPAPAEAFSSEPPNKKQQLSPAKPPPTPPAPPQRQAATPLAPAQRHAPPAPAQPQAPPAPLQRQAEKGTKEALLTARWVIPSLAAGSKDAAAVPAVDAAKGNVREAQHTAAPKASNVLPSWMVPMTQSGQPHTGANISKIAPQQGSNAGPTSATIERGGPPAKAVCPGSHKLQAADAKYSGYCDLCERSFFVGTRVWRCEICRYDVCLKCPPKELVVPTCPALHRLVEELAVYAGYCDRCGTPFDEGLPVRRCATCSYDVCMVCPSKARAAAVAAGTVTTAAFGPSPAAPPAPSSDNPPRPPTPGSTAFIRQAVAARKSRIAAGERTQTPPVPPSGRQWRPGST